MVARHWSGRPERDAGRQGRMPERMLDARAGCWVLRQMMAARILDARRLACLDRDLVHYRSLEH